MSRFGHLLAIRHLRAVGAPRPNTGPDRLPSRTADHAEVRRGPTDLQGPPPSADSDTTVYWIMLFVGAAPVLAVFLQGGPWGAGPTIGALFCVFALRSLFVACVVHRRDRSVKP